MIIYKNTIDGFIKDTEFAPTIVASISAQLKDKMGFVAGIKEKESWKSTLASSRLLLEKLNHKKDQWILLEFKIPSTRKRIDIIVVGSSKGEDNLCIIELKGWSNIKLVENNQLLHANVSYGLVEHPSYEAKDYSSFLSDKYSDISSAFNVSSLSWLPNYENSSLTNPLTDSKYNDILKICSVHWGIYSSSLLKLLFKKFNGPIEQEKVEYLNKLEYKISVPLQTLIKKELNSIELIGSQRRAYSMIKYLLEKNINKKTCFFLSGSAGSGKTVIALKVLGLLVSNKYNVKMEIPGIEFRASVMKTFRQQCPALISYISGVQVTGIPKEEVLIIDEAHKAIGYGTWKQHYDSVFKNVKNVIAMIDNNQVINKKGVILEQLEKKALDNGYEVVKLNLEEQLRNGSDATYTEWLKGWIFPNDFSVNEEGVQESFRCTNFNFEVLNEKDFNSKYKSLYSLSQTRLVSFWTQNWNISDLDENNMPIKNVKIGNSFYAWNPNDAWFKKFKKSEKFTSLNKTQKAILTKLCDRDNFLVDKKGYEYIGYFNSVQGSEFENIFVHIPKLFFLNDANQIDVDLSELHMGEMKSQIWSINSKLSKKEIDEKTKLNKIYFLNRLFVNLTRATKSCYVYVEDEKLRDYIEKRILH